MMTEMFILFLNWWCLLPVNRVVGRIMCPPYPKVPMPPLKTMMMLCYEAYGEGKLRLHIELGFLINWPWDGGDYPRLSIWALCNCKSPYKWKMEARESGSESCHAMWERLDQELLAWMMQEGYYQGMSAVSRNWIRLENLFSLRASRKEAALPTLWF